LKKIEIENSLYQNLFGDIADILKSARSDSARYVNTILTVSYWKIGQRIVEFEQLGFARAEYGNKLIEKLSSDLTEKFGKGFSARNLWKYKDFYLTWQILPTLSAESENRDNIPHFNLPWSHYVRLLSVKTPEARKFYEKESLKGGWSVRQLDRQISTQYFERLLLSKNKAEMIQKSDEILNSEFLSPENAIKDPFILEFLGLKDEYSESDLEDALINHLEAFLLELGSDFAFIGRQRRLRIGDEWYRIDLLFFHRKLKSLVIIDLKVGKFSHADAGQMHMYLNYAKENWMNEGENPPIGLILCSYKDIAVAKYALDGLPNKVIAAEYRLKLPNEKILQEELEKTQRFLLENKRT
jgi:predicted nuclease of restriction endonuclease-like (RecB) superfamily